MTKKFITENGVRKLNPAYVRPKSAVPFVNAATALPVVSTPSEEEEIVVTAAYTDAVALYHQVVEPEIFVSNNNDELVHDGLGELNQVLAKYEVPAGLLGKLLLLRNYAVAEIIVDDSGSMGARTDALGPQGESLSRWWEAKYRISQMMELMAYVVSPVVYVRFLNRPDVLEFQRHDGEMPTAYIARIESLLVEAFQRGPNGGTPALPVIQESLARYPNQAVLRYFLGDGVPNGGDMACRQIEQLLMHRSSPMHNPFTFMSCTNDDAATEWMKECEEKAPYCAEFDDYLDESREILKDQGQAFPYSFGLHLVGQLVAAFCPDDLDAMDESVPFTRQTLESLLGYQSSPQEYKYYFDSFVAAQRKLPPTQTYGSSQFINKLPSLYEQFEATPLAKDIPVVAEYKRALKVHSHQRAVQQQQRGMVSQQQEECCVLL
jgi:hypothetical protein